MRKIKISAVSYLNALPFIYGIENSLFLKGKYILEKDNPSVCADKLINNKADLGLIPVAEISKVKNQKIISNYCIGACGKVKTVLLVSDFPLHKIKTVLLDYQSRTSVKLAQILAKKYWNIKPNFIPAKKDYENNISGETAGVIIGDRTFNLNKNYKYIFDLSEEWTKFTALPFVFAAWVSNKKLPDNFVNNFNEACKFGLNNIDKIVKKYLSENYLSNIDLENYLKYNISYSFDNEKRKGMKKFLNYL